MKNKWLKLIIWGLLIGAVIWAGKGIFKYSVYSTHDGDHHIARSFDAIRTFAEGQFPLRWAGSLNYFCGAPIYNFFYPLIYYLVIFIHFLTHDVIFSLKIINFLSLLTGTVFFYLWIKKETGGEIPALGGALTYLYAPYRFLLIFVRGSPEYLAYAILPVVLYLYAVLFKSAGKKDVWIAFMAALAGGFLTISHNFTVMFLMPLIFIHLAIKIYQLRPNIKKIFLIAFSYISAFGFGSFFIGPALLEQKFTKIGDNFLQWREHFPTLGQLIKSPWGYFYSSLGTANDGMSFMLGYAQWVILGLAGLFVLYLLIRRKLNPLVIYYFILSLGMLYLILPYSMPVWEKLPMLQEIQFSWRLLGILVFTISALFAFILNGIKSKKLLLLIFIPIAALAFYGNRNHLLPQPISGQDVYRYGDFEKLHPHRYSTTTLGDDVIATNAPKACWFDVPLISTEKEPIEFNIVEKGNTYGSVKFVFPTDSRGDTLIMGLGYFPGIYTFKINGKNILPSDCSGRVCFDRKNLTAGGNYLSWKVSQSPIESFFNYVTLAFFVLWLMVLIGIKKIKPFILPLLVMAVFLFFRIYNLPGRVGFGWDQERDARAAMNILSGNLTLIGPRVQGPWGFFLPPYFFYLMAPFYAIFQGGIHATTFFIGFWSVLFFTVAYLIIAKVFNKATALIFLVLWAVNPLAVAIDTIAWNPVAIPLAFLVLIYLVYFYFKNHNNKYLFWIGLVIGVGTSFHVQFLFTLPLLIPLLIDVIKNRKLSGLINAVSGFLLPFLPILVFDLRHNFLNIKLAMGFLSNQGIVYRVLPVWDNFVSFMFGISPVRWVSLALFVLVALFLFRFGKKVKDKVQGRIFMGLGYVWLGFLPLFYLISKNPSEYYFNYLLVIAVLLTAYLLSLKKIWKTLLLILLIMFFINQSRPLLRNVRINLREKENSVIFLKEITKGGDSFNVSFNVPANEDAGFRYLLDYYQVKYSGDPKDPLIEFVIPPDKISTPFVFSDIGVYIPSSWTEKNWIR